jgi:hypothetical protein
MQSQNDERDKKMQEFSGKLNEDRTNRQNVQQQLAFNLARVSPATTFSLLATTLSGTSLQLKEKFRNEATSYQQAYANFIKAKTGLVPGGRMMVFRMEVNGEKPKQIDPYEMPVFEYHPFTLNDVFSSSMIDFGLLVVFNLLFFIGAYVAFIRYDVR